jgi:SNF2 family DNA or RNA helicase
MTAAGAAPAFTPARELPNGASFYSPVGLYEFQADHVAEAYLRTNPGLEQGLLAIWSTGLGKTILGMALAVLLFEDDQIDLVVVAAERNKIVDWKNDFEAFTALDVHRYHGTGRQKRLAKAIFPHVIVSTYETLRAELVSSERVPDRKTPRTIDGELMTTLGLRGKRVLWIFDEITALKSRSSLRHKAFAYVLKELRKGPNWQRVIGLTATPAESDFEDSYNLGRIASPSRMPTVADFEERFTTGRDPYGRYHFRKSAREEFGALFRPICLVKHKTDPDVIEQFPEQIEKAIRVPLETAHRKFYEAVQEMVTPTEDDSIQEAQRLEQVSFTILRMTAGHPASHLYAANPISRSIVEIMGVKALREMTSSKSVELIQRLKPLVKGQGEQVIVFSFFGRSVLKALGEDLRSAGFSVLDYHGGNSLHANERSKMEFIAGRGEILLASDAAAKGLNLPNATYVFEYESALTYALRTQRINRVHRLGSLKPSVTCYTLIAEDTLEVPIVGKVLRRNADHDAVVGQGDGEGYVSAADRREILGFGKKG